LKNEANVFSEISIDFYSCTLSLIENIALLMPSAVQAANLTV